MWIASAIMFVLFLRYLDRQTDAWDDYVYRKEHADDTNTLDW